MPLFFHILVSLLATATVLLSTQMLPLRKHPLFYLLSFQALIYCFIAPTYAVYSSDSSNTDLGDWYFYLQSLCLVIFLPTFILSYRACDRSPQGDRSRSTLSVNRFRLAFFNLFCSASAVFYLATLTYFGLLFRRIGHSALADAYLSLPTLIFLWIRTYDRLLLSLVIASYITFRSCPKGQPRKLALIGFLFTFGAQVIVTALNSRFQLINTFALLWVVNLACNFHEGKRSQIHIPWRKVAMGLFLLAGLNFTLNFRTLWQGDFSETFDLSLLYTHVSSEISDDAIEDISNRLDGLGLIALMAPELSRSGYSWGASWYPSFLATFGYLWNPDAAREVKANMATSPKYYLMYEYAGIDMVDYPSCLLTDAYGNFSILGIFIAGLVLGVGCSLTQQFLTSPPSRFLLALGIVAIQVITLFEASLLHHLLMGWIQYLPALAILYFISPIEATSLQYTPIPKNLRSGKANYAPLNRQHLYSRL